MLDRFDKLQRELRSVWPTLTMRTTAPHPRTVVVVHSLSLDAPPQLAPVFPAYEERFLCLVLSLLRTPGSRVVYVTSQPALQRVVDYWFHLTPSADTEEARARLFLVSPVDGTPRPLSEKLLERPRLLERIRRLVVDPRLAIIIPFLTSDLEAELAVALGIPIYGSEPGLWQLGSKSGARRIFAEEGVPHPLGFEGIHGLDELLDAILAVRAAHPDAREVVVKLNHGFGGYGNGIVALDTVEASGLHAAIRLEDELADPEEFLALLERGGGIVEERIAGDEYRSPSVQLRASPEGHVEVLSTHDQILGGPQRLTFLGSRFPADPEYARTITRLAETVGARLALAGAIGRFAIDFVVVRDRGGEWRPYAIEINLRCGGTTHTFIAAQGLTDGEYDVERAEFRGADGRLKHYVASDHLEGPEYARLTPDDLLDLIPERGLGWDEERLTGIAFHMMSALAVAGRVGATAIGNSPEEAQALYERARRALDEESASGPPSYKSFTKRG